MVKFTFDPGVFIVELTAIHNTPWDAYKALAKMVREDIEILECITNLYYNS